MKLNLKPEMLFGSFLILWGITLLVEQFVGIKIPLWNIFWPFLLIYIGFILLFGSTEPWSYKKKFYSYTIHPDEQDERT